MNTAPSRSSDRFAQGMLIVSTLGFCWLAAQVLHEAGHVLAAGLTGGTVQRVVLGPLVISRTDVSPNPAPLAVAWGGPLGGSLLACLAWLALWMTAPRFAWLGRFLTGMCLVVNGAYLGSSVLHPVGDAETILAEGGAGWHLALFGGSALVGGLVLWHSLGVHFGLGRAPVDRRAAAIMTAALVGLAVLEVVAGWACGLGSLYLFIRF